MIERTRARRWVRTVVPMAGMFGSLIIAGACDDTNNVTTPVITAAVTVFKDSAFDFTTLRTFAMPDSVVQLTSITAVPGVVQRQFDRVVLDEVRADFLARGYVQIPDPQIVQPDFIVLVSVATNNGFNAFVGFPWFSVWGFSPVWRWFTNPGFDSSWGIVFPWFRTAGSTSFPRGTLIVEIIPTSTVNVGSKTITAVWAGVATGLIGPDFTSVTVTAAIDRMFQLSPYLTAPNP